MNQLRRTGRHLSSGGSSQTGIAVSRKKIAIVRSLESTRQNMVALQSTCEAERSGVLSIGEPNKLVD